MLFLQALRVHLNQLSCRKTLFIRLLFNHVFLLQSRTLFFPVFLVFTTDPTYYHFIGIVFLLKNICNQSCISIETVTASSVPAPCTKQTLEARSKSLLNGKPKGKVGQNHALLTLRYSTNACLRTLHSCIKSNKCLHQV